MHVSVISPPTGGGGQHRFAHTAFGGTSFRRRRGGDTPHVRSPNVKSGHRNESRQRAGLGTWCARARQKSQIFHKWNKKIKKKLTSTSARGGRAPRPSPCAIPPRPPTKKTPPSWHLLYRRRREGGVMTNNIFSLTRPAKRRALAFALHALEVCKSIALRCAERG